MDVTLADVWRANLALPALLDLRGQPIATTYRIRALALRLGDAMAPILQTRDAKRQEHGVTNDMDENDPSAQKFSEEFDRFLQEGRTEIDVEPIRLAETTVGLTARSLMLLEPFLALNGEADEES
jgi:hypothetical protein